MNLNINLLTRLFRFLHWFRFHSLQIAITDNVATRKIYIIGRQVLHCVKFNALQKTPKQRGAILDEH